MSGFAGDVGILSIDIDGNDYWVFEKIKNVNPEIIICEYNAVFGDMLPVTVPYDENFMRTEKHFSNLYFGASIKALCLLAESKGYSFAGTNSVGNNAFFVRNDKFEKIDQLIKNKKAFPSKFRESRDKDGRLTYLNGMDRLKTIKNMPVVRLDTNETVELGSIEHLYSEQWG